MALSAEPAPLRLADFAGDWQLSKSIRHAADDAVFHFAGRASVTASAAGMARYVETGHLWAATAGGAGEPPPGALVAERSYVWAQVPAGIEVRFADGRDFHLMTAGAGPARHDCAPDLYEVAYDFGAWPVWRAEWRVRGPQKDYLMQVRYSR